MNKVQVPGESKGAKPVSSNPPRPARPVGMPETGTTQGAGQAKADSAT